MASQGDTPLLADEVPVNHANTYVCRLISLDRGNEDLPAEIQIKPGCSASLGRNRDCDYRLTDAYVSGLHCKITHNTTDNELWIKDYSSNGTFIDGRKLGKGNTTTLVNGNKITFSRAQIGYSVESFLDQKEEQLLADKYHFRGELGRGAFSVVKKATSVETGTMCAVKIINKAKLLSDPKMKDQVMREIQILKKLDHPHVVRYLDCVDTPSKMYIVLEFADGGELFEHILANGAFPEAEAKDIFWQLLQAVCYLHEQGITHRDIKPENILVHGGMIKISDFGLAKLAQSQHYMKTLCGTPQYVAPEIIQMASNQNTIDGYTSAVDMWSLGVVLYLLVTGRQPFFDAPTRDLSLYSQIEAVSYTYPEDQLIPVSIEAKDLISKLLQSNPIDRLTASEALLHPWLAEISNPSSSTGPPNNVSQGTLSGSRKRVREIKSTPMEDGLMKGVEAQPNRDSAKRRKLAEA